MTTWHIERTEARLEVSGQLRIHDATDIWRTLRATTSDAATTLDIDLAGTTVVDGAIMALLVELRASLIARGIASELVGAPAQLAPLVRLYHGDRAPIPGITARRQGAVAQLGNAVEGRLQLLGSLVDFLGELASSIVAIVRRRSSANTRALPGLIERAGTDGLPIVLLLNFLVGFVMAFQTMQTLRLYGANIYVADIVGVSVTRELGPLITAVIISGRSGAAYAAELGTMRVSEEVDALRTMGIAPVPYLVLPRVLALALVAPALTLIGDVAGVTGGLVVAAVSLDISPHAYIAELRTIVVPSDVWTGLVKSVGFGVAIAFIGSQRGLSARGSASAVGRATTATVVTCLFTIVIIDTLFTILFLRFGL
ncbi:MAG: MlaE family lipid ABC transporter permease subunit [Deltaproteobacteria bacterium]|nr:MlaE family lipid ABC transporter permease subunit [Deltaproteobacteria bacterium]